MRCAIALALIPAVALGALAAARGEDVAADAGLEALMQRLATVPGLRARFVETREVALLREPLRSEGRLYFAPPDRLARHVERPAPASLVIDGDTLLLRDAIGSERVDLDAQPAARAFADNFVVLFTGNRAALEARYRVAFRGRPERWSMRLVPRSPRMAALVEAIELEGRGVALERLVVRETSGDRTTTVFEEVETDRGFDADEARAVFSADGPAQGG